MKQVFASYNNIISALGFSTQANAENVWNGKSGIEKYTSNSIENGFYSSIIDTEKLDHHFRNFGNPELFTKLEKMMIASLKDVCERSQISIDEKTALIISTTKGNVDCLAADSPFDKSRAYLHELGEGG